MDQVMNFKISFSSFISVILFALLCSGCSKSDESNYDFRLLLSDGNVITNQSFIITTRNTCITIFQSVTDNEGKFKAELDLSESYTVLVDAGQTTFGGIIIPSSIQEGVTNDIIISDFGDRSIRFQNDEDVIFIEEGEVAEINVLISIDNYPLEKSIVELFNQFEDIRIESTPDTDGNVKFEIPDLTGPEEYNFEILLKTLEGQIISNSNFAIIVNSSVDLNLQYEILECNAIRLHWDRYEEEDFAMYQIQYSSSIDDGSCSVLGPFIIIENQDQTETIVSTYPMIENICFEFKLVTQFSIDILPYDTKIQAPNPYEVLVPGTQVESSHLIDSRQVILINQGNPTSLCRINTQDLSSQCTSISPQTSLRAFGKLEDETKIFEINGQFLDVKNLDYSNEKRILTGNIGTVMQPLSNGILASIDIFNNGTLFLTDVNSELINAVNYSAETYDFLQFIPSNQIDELLVIFVDKASSKDVLFRYKITDINNAQITETAELNDFDSGKFYETNSSGSYIISSKGDIFMIDDVVSYEGSFFPSTVQFRRFYMNESNVVFIEDNINVALVYDIQSREKVNEIELCLISENFTFLTNDNKLFGHYNDTGDERLGLRSINILD